jgi:hypothetical protein
MSALVHISNSNRTPRQVRKVPGTVIAHAGQCQNSMLRRLFYAAAWMLS